MRAAFAKGKRWDVAGFLVLAVDQFTLFRVRLCRMSRRWLFELIGVDKRSTQDHAAESYHTMRFTRVRCGEFMRMQQVISCIE